MLAFDLVLKIIATGASLTSASLAVQRFLIERRNQRSGTSDEAHDATAGRLLLLATLATMFLTFAILALSYFAAHRLDDVSQIILDSVGSGKKSIDQIAYDLYGAGKAPPEFYEAVGALMRTHRLKCDTTYLFDIYRSSYGVSICYAAQ